MVEAQKKAAAPLLQARRVVVKVGSALLVDSETGRINRDWLETLIEDLEKGHYFTAAPRITAGVLELNAVGSNRRNLWSTGSRPDQEGSRRRLPLKGIQRLDNSSSSAEPPYMLL